jgi:very-short-patch-repair endonuclease
LSGLEVDGLTGFERTDIFIVLPEGARRPKADGTCPHWSAMLDDEDVHPTRWPRRTRTERSVVDAASWSVSDRQARTIVIAAFQQRLVSARTIRLALTRRGPCRQRALIVQSVLDAVGGIQSLPERDFDRIRLAAGLPRPSRQVRVKGGDGRYYLDVEWADQGIAVEIHGIPHLEVGNWDADLVRANEIVITGRRLVIFSSYAIRQEPGLVADQLMRLFASLTDGS